MKIKDAVKYIRVTESIYPKWDNPVTIKGNCLVLSDVEAPFHHAEFLNKCIELCKVWGIKNVVFNGDLLHFDSLSSFSKNWINGDEIEFPQGLTKELDASRELFFSLQSVFDKAVWNLGNHEGRYLRLINTILNPIILIDILRLNPKWITVKPYYHCYIESNGVRYLASHPKNTSVIPAKVASLLAEKYDCHAIQGHNHLWGTFPTRSGKYIGIECGTGVDSDRLAYHAQRMNTRPESHNGAVIIREGYWYLLHNKWTDWNLLKKL